MRNKLMGGVLAAGLATASLVAVTSSAEAQRWGGHGGGFRAGGFGGGGLRAAGFGGGMRAGAFGGGARVGAFGGGWRGGYGGYGYRRGWGGGGALAAGAALGVLSGAALASTWGGYDGYYGYDYAPVGYGYGYAPATYAYPETAYYEEEVPAVTTYAVPAYRTRRVSRTVAYYPRQRYRSVNVYAGRSGFYGSGFRTAHRSEFRSAQRSNFRTVGYGGAARGHMVRGQQHRWH
jgi:hypothetical protein